MYLKDKEKLKQAMQLINDDEGGKAMILIDEVLDRYEGLYPPTLWSKDDIVAAFESETDEVKEKVEKRVGSLDEGGLEHLFMKMGDLSDDDWLKLKILFQDRCMGEDTVVCDECAIEVEKEDSIETVDGRTLCQGCDAKRLEKENGREVSLKSGWIQVYDKYKDNFTKFQQDHPDIFSKHPECAGDWDAWLIKVGISKIMEKHEAHRG